MAQMLSTGFIKEQSLFIHCPEFSFSDRNKSHQPVISKDLACYTGLTCTLYVSCLHPLTPSSVYAFPIIHPSSHSSIAHPSIHLSLCPSSHPPSHHSPLLINLSPTHPSHYPYIFPFTQPSTSHHMASIYLFTHQPSVQFWALDFKGEGDRVCSALPQSSRKQSDGTRAGNHRSKALTCPVVGQLLEEAMAP